jgi:diacylglycerol kinase family enzyme
VGPGGSVSDGRLELTVLPAMSLPRVLTSIPRLYDGSIARVPGTVHRRVRWAEVEGDLALETDGETRPDAEGRIRWEVVPRALSVRGGWLAPPAQADAARL